MIFRFDLSIVIDTNKEERESAVESDTQIAQNSQPVGFAMNPKQDQETV